MSDLNKSIDAQKRINEAAKEIIDYFNDEVCYTRHLEIVLGAQTQILGLMELAKCHMINHPDDELELSTDELGMFLRYVHLYLRFLKRFLVISEDMGKGGRYE